MRAFRGSSRRKRKEKEVKKIRKVVGIAAWSLVVWLVGFYCALPADWREHGSRGEIGATHKEMFNSGVFYGIDVGRSRMTGRTDWSREETWTKLFDDAWVKYQCDSMKRTQAKRTD